MACCGDIVEERRVAVDDGRWISWRAGDGEVDEWGGVDGGGPELVDGWVVVRGRSVEVRCMSLAWLGWWEFTFGERISWGMFDVVFMVGMGR